MRSVPLLELADARRIAAAAQAEADRRGATVTVALVDSGGHPLLLERRDGASPSSAVAALGKARMAALNGKPTADQEQAINGPRPALLQLACLLGQPAAAMAGGVPLLHNGALPRGDRHLGHDAGGGCGDRRGGGCCVRCGRDSLTAAGSSSIQPWL
jgi:Uncharacterized protein, possibly involved in utilization of glycolate and propanediol